MQNKTSLWLSICACCLSIVAIFLSEIRSASYLKEASKNTAFSESVLLVASQRPEEFMNAIQTGMAKKEEKKHKTALKNLGDKKDILFDEDTPYFIGNPDGSVVFIEFFDYNCGFCTRAYEIVKEVLKEHPEVKIILKEFPILGSSSELAAKAALAAARQGKYQEAHEVLLTNNTPLQNEENIKNFAKSIGVDAKQLLIDIKDPAIEKELTNNVELALALSIQGTPGFISKNNMFPGMLSKDQFSMLIQEELKKRKENASR